MGSICSIHVSVVVIRIANMMFSLVFVNISYRDVSSVAFMGFRHFPLVGSEVARYIRASNIPLPLRWNAGSRRHG